jgi:hypothetical protein
MNKIILLLTLLYSLRINAQVNEGFKIFQPGSKSQFRPTHSIHPDYGVFKFSKTGGKWRNMLGANICVTQYNNDKIGVALHVNPFVELHDFTPNQDMSWQLWRGHIGGNIYLTSKSLNKEIHKNFSAILGVGYTHESQHISSYWGYGNEFLTGKNSTGSFYYDNSGNKHYYNFTYNAANIRTGEYLELNLLLKQKIGGCVEVFSNSAFKYFPKPIAQPSNYDLKRSVNEEIGIIVTATRNIKIHANYFGERIYNTFESNPNYKYPTPYYDYKKSWFHQPLIFNHIESGIILKNKEENDSYFNIFIGFQKSNGRGLDFINKYNEWYGGFKIIL